MIAGCITISKRAVRNTVLAASIGLLQAAAVAPAGAQSVTVEQLMRQLEGKPLAAQPAAGAKFRTRSFSAKENEPVAEPVQSGAATSPAVSHPEVDLEIYFTPASSRITKQAEPDLNVIGRALSHEKFADAKFRIAGHTDGIGGAAYNLDLSRRRAEAVKQFLVTKYKIPAMRIEAVGFGKEQLKVPDDLGSARNRRVQIVNLSATK